jgi:hypothetical protein
MTKFILAILIFLSIISCGKLKEKLTGNDKSEERAELSDKGHEDETEDQITKPQSSGSDEVTGINIGINIPTGINYKGNIVESVSWNDRNGKNILFITETNLTNTGEFSSKELFGYHYVIDQDGTEKLWQINDFVRECPFDLTLEFIPNSLTITDLNDNGIAESTFLYRLSCKSDVSPDDMKLMMHEGNDKYAIRGEMLLNLDGETYGGSSTPDPAFNNAPPEFLTYAKQQWNKFRVLSY